MKFSIKKGVGMRNRLQQALQKPTFRFQSSLWIVPFIIFILNLTLISPKFFPNLYDLNPHDEASYINNGRALVEGNLILYSASPLTSFVYAPIYLLVQNSPYWFLQSAALGRFIIFGLLWLGAYLIARRLSAHAYPYVLPGFLFVTPVLTNIVQNPSDALYTAMSAFGFHRLLTYSQTRTQRPLWGASFFLGLAALTRSDGLVLFLVFITLVIILSRVWKQTGKVIVASILPFTMIVGGYLVIYGLVSGDFEFGTFQRLYAAFEQGQKTVMSEDKQLWMEAGSEARKVYGTPEENNYSVINAIRHNPQAFLNRVKATAKYLPGQLLNTYDKRMAAVIFLLALVGIWRLAKSKSYRLLGLFLLWPAPLLFYFITFFRDGYLLFPYFVLFALASIGLDEVTTNLVATRSSITFTILLAGLVVYGLVGNKLAIFMGAYIFLMGFLIVWAFKLTNPERETVKQAALMMALCAGLVVHGGFPFPNYPTFGEYEGEKALIYLEEEVEPGAKVGAYAPLVPWAAKMTPVIMALRSRHLETKEDFVQWMRGEDLEAIYVEGALKSAESKIWSFIENETGSSLEVGFTSQDGSIQVCLVRTVESTE
jgi:hypothetical protein